MEASSRVSSPFDNPFLSALFAFSEVNNYGEAEDGFPIH